MSDSQRSDRFEMYNIFKVIVILLAFTFMYKHYQSCLARPPAVHIFIKNPKFVTLGPYNTTEYEVDDIYDQLIDIKDFKFKINPQPCDGYEDSGILLLVMVASKPDNFKKRSIIRNTWGRSIDSMKVVFLMGETGDSNIKHESILNESIAHGDIVQGSFIDAYRNMTYKHVMGLKWVAHHCPRARYVLKTDDDVAVNSQELRHYLIRQLSPWGVQDLITCSVIRNAYVLRGNSKWKVTEEEFAGKYYPTYCAGWAILYSADVIPRLLSAAQNLPYFWIDDVHITGVIAENIGVARVPLATLILSYHRMNILTTRGAEDVGPFLFGPPDLTTDKIYEIWRSIPE